jgi:hypothetical protein
LVVDDILKVLYAPHKAFKKIIQEPKYLGALIVIILFAAAQTGYYYIGLSKSYSEQTMPVGDQGDIWTENATLWQATSGVVITNNYVDFINGTPTTYGAYDYYSNSSIEFLLNDSARIQMALRDLNGSVNCGADGFKNFSIRVKIVAPSIKPENVSLYLYSLSDSNFFYYDLTSTFSSSVADVWNNVTIPVGSGDWRSSNTAASWKNITSLKMDFTWSTNSSIDLRVDGLFFRGIFTNPVETYGSEYIIFNLVLRFSMQLIMQWFLLTGLMYLIIKGFKGNVLWKPLMVAVGFALVTMVIQALVLAAAYATLPTLYSPLELLAGVPGEVDAASQIFSNAVASVVLVESIVQIIVFVWVVALGTIITRTIASFSWVKSILVSAVAFVVTVEFLMPLLQAFFGF